MNLPDTRPCAPPVGILLTTRLGFRFTNRPLATEAELDIRIEILRRTALRSVTSVAALRPTWVLQTDPSLAAYLRRRVGDGSFEVPDGCGIHVVARSGTEFDQADIEPLRDIQGCFLCTRLDSDDYYIPDVLERTLERSDLRQGLLVDFPRGYLASVKKGLVRRHSYISQGPFYGIMTDSSDPLPAIGHHEHARAKRRAVSVSERAWIQTVHDGNYVTDFDNASLVLRLRKMRREYVRAKGIRSLRESSARLLDLVPLGKADEARIAQHLY
jgi:hypothetical protein